MTARDSFRARFRIPLLDLSRPPAISVSSRPKRRDPEILSLMNCLAHSRREPATRPRAPGEGQSFKMPSPAAKQLADSAILRYLDQFFVVIFEDGANAVEF
jgi:hypothetical protein